MAVLLRFSHAPAPAGLITLRFGLADGEAPGPVDGQVSAVMAAPVWSAAVACTPAYRPLVAAAGVAWQEAAGRRTDTRVVYQDAPAVAAAVGTVWREARGVSVERAVVITPMVSHGPRVGVVWRDGVPVQARVASSWQAMVGLGARVAVVSQDARLVGVQRSAGWQERLRHARPLWGGQWQEARHVGASLAATWGAGVRRQVAHGDVWQEAMWPRPGRSVDNPPVWPQPEIDACYVPPPGDGVVLRFAAAWLGGASVRFRCGDEGAVAASTVPLLRVYMSVHSVSCVLLPGLEPVRLRDLSVSASADGFSWSLTGSGPLELLDQLSPSGGVPAQVRVSIDGMQWVFAVDGLRRDRRFGEARVQVSGRSVTAMLAEPYSAELSWGNEFDRLAQQCAGDALAGTGVGLAWGVPDWLIPAGAWSHRGTRLSAVLRLAGAVGAVVQSHRSLAQLSVQPRYPTLPWAWGAATADVELPLASVINDGYERSDGPAYNGVYVSGTTRGVLRLVKRAGSAADVLAPMVADALIVADEAARQRGAAILGGAGPGVMASLTMPVLTGDGLPGVIDVGKLIEVVEPAETWRGLVRGVAVQVSEAKVRQTLTVERRL